MYYSTVEVSLAFLFLSNVSDFQFEFPLPVCNSVLMGSALEISYTKHQYAAK